MSAHLSMDVSTYHGIYYEHDRNDDGRKWICSSCNGSIHITSGDCDQCSIMVIAIAILYQPVKKIYVRMA